MAEPAIFFFIRGCLQAAALLGTTPVARSRSQKPSDKKFAPA